jgi:hypothetical protein
MFRSFLPAFFTWKCLLTKYETKSDIELRKWYFYRCLNGTNFNGLNNPDQWS